jgi:hypothetical protein
MSPDTSLVMVPSWHHGYPQPANNSGYLQATYDLTSYCACGTGARQNGPFRVKSAPRWGRRTILQLNWVYDEYFVPPEVWVSVFEPFGVNKRPVVLHSSGKELDSMVQLVVGQDVEVDTKGVPQKTCPFRQCSEVKHFPKVGKRFPAPTESVSSMARSIQYFHDSAFHVVYTSMALYARIHASGLRGVEFDVCG